MDGNRFGDSLRAAEDRKGWKGIVATSAVVLRRPRRLRGWVEIRWDLSWGCARFFFCLWHIFPFSFVFHGIWGSYFRLYIFSKAGNICHVEKNTFLFMTYSVNICAPNFEEVVGAYWFRVFRASMRPSIRHMHAISYEACMLGFWNFIYGRFFFSCPRYLPFWSYASLKKSEWNLMHVASYEPCLLRFWNFIYGFPMVK